jgi:release factor glutamine methyltransferase
MPTLREAVARGRGILAAAGIAADEAALDAELLARHVLGWDRARLVANRRDEAPPTFEDAYRPLIARRAAREPIAYITGHREFWGLDFEVTREVLIPRPETELIVEEAIALYGKRNPGLIVDLGTGSGCIAIALALEFPKAELIATDVSAPALAVARRNAIRHGVNNRIAFVQSGFTAMAEGVDLTVSNPPYIALGDKPSLQPEVRDYEPGVALFAGHDGLDVYRVLLSDAIQTSQAEGGHLIVEVGYDQHPAVAALAERAGWTLERVRQDLQGITRTLVFRCEPYYGER